MKKIITLSLVAILLFSLCSCGGKPEKTSDAMYQIGTNALATADEYIGGKITGDEAADRLHEYMEQADTQYKKECEDLRQSTLVDTEYSNDGLIEHNVSMLYFSVSSSTRSGAAISEVQEKRDSLADSIGK